MNRLLAGLALIALAGCDAGTGSISLTARPSASTQALIVGTGAADGDALSRVRILINEAELHGGRGGCHGPLGSAPGLGISFCANRARHIEQGPFVVTIDAAALAEGAVSEPVLIADVPAGTYRGAELELEPLGTQHFGARPRPVAELGAEFDDFKASGSTVIIDGTWGGKDFTYQAAFEAEQETAGPLTVAPGKDVSLGLTVDASTWFVDATGAALDPSDPTNHAAIAGNLVRSLTIKEEGHSPR